MTLIISESNGRIKAEGELTFHTTPQAIQEGLALLRSSLTIKQLDLSLIKRIDSSGLAFIIALQREAENTARKLAVVNIPEQMQAVVDVYGLETLFPNTCFKAA